MYSGKDVKVTLCTDEEGMMKTVIVPGKPQVSSIYKSHGLPRVMTPSGPFPSFSFLHTCTTGQSTPYSWVNGTITNGITTKGLCNLRFISDSEDPLATAAIKIVPPTLSVDAFTNLPKSGVLKFAFLLPFIDGVPTLVDIDTPWMFPCASTVPTKAPTANPPTKVSKGTVCLFSFSTYLSMRKL